MGGDGHDDGRQDLLGFEPFSEPPTDDELLAMARGEVGAWPHNLYVNPAVGVKMAEEFGGGRGLYNISDHVIPTGSLIAFERPLLIEPSYDQLLSSLQSAVADSKNKAIIEKLFSGSTEGAADLDLEGILSHNYMAEEPLPVNGKRNVTDDKLFNRVGLWPFLSMANHYYLPNVTRSHIGKEGYLASRAIKDIPPGGQVLDNYCPTLMPWVERNKVTHSQHGFNEPFDSKYDMSPPEELTALMQAVREIKQALVAGQPTAEQYALAGEEGDSDGSIEPPTVKEHSEMCFQSLIGTLEEVDGSLKDPSLAVAYSTLADAGWGNNRHAGSSPLVINFSANGSEAYELEVHALSESLALAMSREPYSFVSCTLSVRLVLAARRVLDDDKCAKLEQMARKHFRVVFGGGDSLFDYCNNALAAPKVD
ncbi:hypothetical protein FOZ62_023956 [Perkinsus olseni]|uniref:SET domain-containing protein n=1 Tax=Perkinsus olseni TaxID=32597 RepID=A0A7J6STV1_PEROL|nr:hypothetical protein FOZ62_023956 [Perkinsus olseni]